MNNDESSYLKAAEILERARESNNDFNFDSNLQIINVIRTKTREGRPYLVLSLRDNTDEITRVNKWIESNEEFEEVCESFKIGNIIEFTGEYSQRYGSVSIRIYRFLNEGEFDLDDFISDLPNLDEEELFGFIEGIILNLNNKNLKLLLDNIFEDEQIKSKYVTCPSAIEHHHVYKCGNLQHTINMMKIFQNLEESYDQNTLLDIELIKTGIILHDIGKISEYSINNGVPMYVSGLTGHIILGDRLVSRFINEIEDFPIDLANRLRHLILSHHGRKEWGAPVEPQFPEAEILHHLDMLDSRF